MTHALTLSSEAMSTLNQRALPFAAVVAVQFAVSVTKWANRRRTRIALSKLDAHLLSDIGLTREAALTESARPFWRV